MPSPAGAVKGAESCHICDPSAKEYQKAIDFANNLAAHNDNQEELRETRRILLHEWLFATDGPFATHCFLNDDTEAAQQQ